MEAAPEADLGVSHYDHVFCTYRCCNCNEPVALSLVSEQLLLEDEYDRWRRKDLALTSSLRHHIAQRVHQHYEGHMFSRTQYIHARCLAALQQPDQAERLREIRARGEFVLPSETTDRIYPINYALYDTRPCAYCHWQVDMRAQGTGYKARGNDSAPMLYIHFSCYTCLARKRLKTDNPPGLPPLPAEPADPATHKRTNEAWSRVLGRGVASRDTLRAYAAWKEARENSNLEWTDEQWAAWWELERQGKNTVERVEDDLFVAPEDDALAARMEETLRREIRAATDSLDALDSDALHYNYTKLNILLATRGASQGRPAVDGV